MYHYYFDGPAAEEIPPAPPTEALREAQPPEPSRYVRAETPPAPERPRGKPRGERGAAIILTVVALLLGGTAALLALRPAPVDISAWAGGGYPELPSISSPNISASSELERWPNGDGTVLTLDARPQAEPISLQEIYRRVSPTVVSINALLPMGVAQGTGVIMSADGYLITNAHVIADALRVDVSLADGGTYRGMLVGSDPSTDLAVLKIDAEALTPAVFGDSEDMLVGDTVVAIGNPMGEELRGTMTDGILSAINRDMEVDGNPMTLLQTTAALNTGNSGGALVNDQGQVIGITNMKMVSTVYNNTLEGLGFAIPTATVKPVVDSLIASGHVTGRPTLGITVRGLYEGEKAERKVETGILVVSLTEGSDAAGKLKEGDILLTADGAALSSSQDLLEIKEAHSVGESIGFQVDRAGERLEISVALMEQYELQ